MIDPRLAALKKSPLAYWGTRIISQIEYAVELSRLGDGKYDALINTVITYLGEQVDIEQVLTRSVAQKAEAMLSSLAAEAKSFKMMCVGHAHIDMNWMWRWDETVAISLDTFRTVLDLMREYPTFTFSQSQASVYRIVEEYDPQMLEEIRQRVKEGRWEVAASTWVEADKNMPSGESHARHLLYTRSYLTHLLDIAPDAVKLDYEPDTFGHNRNVPEVLADGGIRYYYHCRGDNFDHLYNWEAPSGRSILVYREPTWYLGYIDPGMAVYVPDFCKHYGMDTMMKVYGVGDHGGGPTRRDIERIIDMNTWTVFPTICFGTYNEFYSRAEKATRPLKVVKGELNFVFTGCYTSQSRIKKANRIGENALHEAEAYNTVAALASGLPYSKEGYAEAWKKILFNQFHDIIPGSGVIDTREYALASFQAALATASSQKVRSFHALAKLPAANNQVKEGEMTGWISEGAGVGFGVEEFKISQVSRGGGKKRSFHIFNPSFNPRVETAEFVIWDWEGDTRRLVVKDVNGNVTPHQVLDQGTNAYWGHNYLRVVIQAAVPACGFSTYLVNETEAMPDPKIFPLDPRVEIPDDLTLENDFLKARFDILTCSVISLVDKSSGEELADPQRPMRLRIIDEDDHGMTAWVVGRYMSINPLVGVRVVKVDHSALRQSLAFEASYKTSKFKVTISLDLGSPWLDFAVEADWHEIGTKGVFVPQFNFIAPLGFQCKGYRFDIPFGVVDRQPNDLDVPANSWAAALRDGVGENNVGLPTPEGKRSAMLISGCGYGFRCVDNSLALTLIRSSYDPDPTPEVGIHKMHFAVGVVDRTASNKDLIDLGYRFAHPFDILSGKETDSTGISFVSLQSGSAALSALKLAEDSADGRDVIVRLYETEGQETQVSLKFAFPVKSATWVDVHEKPISGANQTCVTGTEVSFAIPAWRLVSLKVHF